MTFSFDNVYVGERATVTGPYEKRGPLGNYFDKSYTDLYNGEKSFEKAEVKLSLESIEILKKKIKKDNFDILIGGDLLNQITATCYAARDIHTPFLGIYGACSTSMEGIIIASSLIDSKKVNDAVVTVSSHNMASEKQFRNPTEYGAPKPNTATFTATGGASIYLTNKKTKIKVDKGTIGKVNDMDQKDPMNMGAVMAIAAADTIKQHLDDTKRDLDYYDLILTGDLGTYGKQILREAMMTYFNLELGDNYDDCGVLLYDLENQKEVKAGGSGPVCNALVNYSYIMKEMEKGTYKKVLLVATGALFSPTFSYLKMPILSIAHAVSLEVI